jgi:hypothetical protein
VAESVEVIEFRPPDLDPIVDAMEALAAKQHGWITLQPGVRPNDAPPPRSVLGSLFSGTGPPVPVGTWVAPEPKQKPPHPEFGLLHQAGPKVVRRLAADGLDVPDHWVVLADHPRRGLVVAVHPESPHREVLEWILSAAERLTKVPLTGTWQASIHGRS